MFPFLHVLASKGFLLIWSINRGCGLGVSGVEGHVDSTFLSRSLEPEQIPRDIVSQVERGLFVG